MTEPLPADHKVQEPIHRLVRLRDLRDAWRQVRAAMSGNPFELLRLRSEPVLTFRRYGFELGLEAERALRLAMP